MSRLEQVADESNPDLALEWRLMTYPRLFLAVVAVAFLIVVASGRGSTTVGGRVGGDYPAFYSAGSLVADGRVDDLFSPVAQSAEQVDLLGSSEGFFAFAYAPHVAVVYAPLSLLPYRVSYVVHTALMLTALVAALALIRPMVGILDRRFTLVVALAIGFYPMFMAIGGGQNTAVTVLLLSWIWRSLEDDHEANAGIAVALLIFRPQYAIPMIGLLLVSRHLRAVGFALAGVGITWVLNALILGPGWIFDWLDQVGPFLATDAEVNGHNAVGLVGFLQALLGTDSAVALAIGAVASVCLAVGLAFLWGRRRTDLAVLMAITSAGIILISPHTMFYDAGLVVLTLIVAVDRRGSHWLLVPITILAALAHAGSSTLGFSPFAPVVLAIFVYSLSLDPPTVPRPSRLAPVGA